MNKIFKLFAIALMLAACSVGYTFMMGFSFGTPEFAKCVSSSFGTGIFITVVAFIFFDISLDD